MPRAVVLCVDVERHPGVSLWAEGSADKGSEA